MLSVILKYLSSSDKDQECDISEAQLETDGGTTGVEVDAGQLGKVGAQAHALLLLVVIISYSLSTSSCWCR